MESTCILSLDGCLEGNSLVTCPGCQNECCKRCLDTGIALQKSVLVHCPCCKEPWSRVFVDEIFSTHRAFKLKRKRVEEQAMLTEQERLMPATMIMVKRTREVLKLEKSIAEMNGLLNDLKRQVHVAKTDKARLIATRLSASGGGVYSRCGSSVCKGFVMEGADGVCDLCGGQTCSDCMHWTSRDAMEVGSDRVRVVLMEVNMMGGSKVMVMLSVVSGTSAHECRQEDVDTVRLLKETTQSCPECHAYIEKIDGCNDMFCTLCHVEFNYRTGVRTNRASHQPERQRFLNGGGVLGESGRVWFPTAGQLSDLCVRYKRTGERDINVLRELTQMKDVCVEVDRLRQSKYTTDVRGDVCAAVRVELMMGQSTQAQFKRAVIRLNREKELNTEIGKILGEYVRGTSNIYREMMESVNRYVAPMQEGKYNIKGRTREANEMMKKLSETYKKKVPVIPEEYSSFSRPRVEIR